MENLYFFPQGGGYVVLAAGRCGYGKTLAVAAAVALNCAYKDGVAVYVGRRDLPLLVKGNRVYGWNAVECGYQDFRIQLEKAGYVEE